jgi:probable HAF family extracellular repeat protein
MRRLHRENPNAPELCKHYGARFAATVALVTLAAGAVHAETGRPPLSLQAVDQRSTTQTGVNARAQWSLTQYYLVNLGVIGGKYSAARGINNLGWITGASSLKGSKSSHAALWRAGRLTDLGTLGGPNSYFNDTVKNTRGELAGVSQVSKTDPNLEDFCQESFFNGKYLCQGFSWKNGVMTPLAPLGGNNSFATGVNNRGQVVGGAETSTQDSSCSPPQVFDYRGVIWQPNGEMLTLPPYPGDTVSFANAINNVGQAVGSSGSCGPLDYQATAAHALLWQSGSTIDLGNLGGTENNVPFAINARGQVVGYSNLPGDATSHAFLWQNGVMSDLGTLPGDVFSVANGMNDKGQIVGESCPASGSCRGFIWENGSMTDLNLLVPTRSRLYVFYASDINDSGQIVGIATNTTKHVFTQRAVVLIPGKKSDVLPGSSAPLVSLPEALRIRLQKLQGIARPFPSP